MSTTLLPSVLIETQKNPQYTVIWLHGLGSDGHDFASLIPELELDEHAIRFILPHAPIRPVTINGGYEMRAWYDIISVDLGREIDTLQMEESRIQVEDLIEDQIQKGISRENIFVVGFSQGGAVAIMTALRSKTPLAGLLALSTYLGDEEALQDFNSHQMPIAILHGTHDNVVPCELGQSAFQKINALGANIEWKDYPMAHSVCPQEIDFISKWFKKHIGNK